MNRRTGFGSKLRKEARVLIVRLVFLAAALWLGFFVFPDILAALFLDTMDLSSPATDP